MSARERRAGSRILIVEDDYLVGVELESGLRDAGFEVVGIAATAMAAVRLACMKHPALAIMDIHLAGKRDGVDAALEMRETSGTRCVFATAHCEPEMRARAERAAPLGWLAKPYAFDALLSMIDRALNELKRQEP